MTDASATPAPSVTAPVTRTVTLQHPIQRTGGPVETLTLRKPKAGELRGLKMTDLMAADVNTVIEITPRICSPMIIREEVAGLEADDFAELAGTIVGFFMTSAQQDLVRQMSGTSA